MSDAANNPGVPGTAPSDGSVAQVIAALIAKDQPGTDAAGNPTDPDDRVSREHPQPGDARRKLVARWIARVKADKKHWAPAFRRMTQNMAFTHGDQWSDGQHAVFAEIAPDPRYVANIALRHVQARTASLYATNPTVVAKKRERMMAALWDGDMATLQAAQQQLAAAAAAAAGMPPPPPPGAPPPPGQGVPPGEGPPGQASPGLPPGPPQGPAPAAMPQDPTQAMAIVADFKNVQNYDKMLGRISKTLELLWEYNIDEQSLPFKSAMKLTVRRAIVAGVGYVKMGFQRAMKMRPEITTRIADMQERLATLQRLADDISDNEKTVDDAEGEELRLTIQALMQEPQLIVREGLLFDYPDSFAIIPDRKCKSLRGFLGADWVTQEYALTPDEIQEVYGIDIGTNFRVYSARDREGTSSAEAASRDDEDIDQPRAVVWEIYHRKDGLVYVACDGYPDFLQEPAVPDTYLDRFYPWFPLVLNEGYSDRELFPKSDIDLLRDMQLELNRARQGLREHRRANRPKMVAAAGILEESDKEKLQTHPANALLELNALAPGQKCEDVLQPMKMPAIDPALYDTNATFEDVLRVLGQDQASWGQTTSATATEASVAQASQHNDLSSSIDDQDELLSEMAMAGGKLLMLNVSVETVKKVIGPGAVWPELTKADIVEAVYLTVRQGSTGRPNKQAEIQNAQILFPMLQRVPGINPEWMARELIKRMDDRLDLTEAFVSGMPSMDALNKLQGASPGAPMAPPQAGPNDPNAQAGEGSQNAQAPPPTNGLLGPRTPPVPGANGLMPGHGGGPATTPQGGLPMP